MNKPKAGTPCVTCGHPAEMHFSCEIGGFCKACDSNVPDTFKWEHVYRSEASSPAAPADSAEELARKLAIQLLCRHEHTEGGNDYVRCRDCELEWDYRHRDPLLALKAFGTDVAALLRSRMGER